MVSRSEDIKRTLQKPDIHLKWIKSYRTPENERFYELATDKIVRAFNAPPGSLVLDAGCGDCRHSVRFAKRGFRGCAVDFSTEILKKAETNIRGQGLQERITLKCEDITSLSFGNDSFEYVFCWGVLMHIPEFEKAVAELCRVLKPGGRIAISETNMYSPQAVFTYGVRRIIRNNNRTMVTPGGIEDWIPTPAGPLLARKANIGYLIGILRKNNVIVKQRWPGQFTELYTRLKHPLPCKAIHAWNEFWFRFVRLPGFALCNILLGEKLGPG